MEINDAFYEMIIGQDVWEYSLNIINTALNVIGLQQHASPGPGYRPNTSFMGHNIRLATASEVPADLNEFLEYNCNELLTISRLALNKVSRQLIIIREGTLRTFLYDNLPLEFDERLENVIFDDHTQIETVMEDISTRCKCTEVEAFPSQTILVNWSSFIKHRSLRYVLRNKNDMEQPPPSIVS